MARAVPGARRGDGRRRWVPAIALALAACTGTPSADPAPSAPTPTPTAATSVTPAEPGAGHEWTATSTRPPAPAEPATTGRLGLAPVARVPVPAGMHVTGLVLAGGRVAWSGCRPCAGAAQDPVDVFVADLVTGRTRTVARTGFRWGSTRVVGIGGDDLVWLDEADVRDGGVPHTQWALRVLDLRSGRAWTAAEGGRRGDRLLTPVVVVGADRVTWQLLDVAAAHGPVRQADLRSRAVRTVVPDLAGVLSGVTPGGFVSVVHEPPSLTVVPDGPAPVDAYLTPSGGGRPSALTSGHDVDRADVAGGHVVWATRQGTGETLWSAPVADTTAPPVRLFAGPVLTFAGGSGFAAWTTRETLPVVQVGAGTRPVTLPDVPAEGGVLAADGDRLALLTVPERGAEGPVTVLVTRVLPAR